MATMQPSPGAPADRPDDEALKYRLDFAQRCFSNAQELTRLMDEKAAYLLAVVGILTAALGTFLLAAKTLEVNPVELCTWRWVVGGVLLASLLAYLLVAFLVVRAATKVHVARHQRGTVHKAVPGLLFPLMLLQRCQGDESVYAQRLAALTPADILRDYAHQIVEISTIYQDKQEHVNRAASLFGWLVFGWMVATVLVVAFPFLIHVP